MEQYNVTGMSCAACSARVEKAVSKVPGVTACSVSLLTNSMGVEGDAPAQAIIAAVQEAGYGASRKADAGAKAAAPGADALADRETPVLRRRLIASLGFLAVLMYFSMGHMMWGWPIPAWFEGNHVAMGLLMLLTGMSWPPLAVSALSGLLADLIYKTGKYQSSSKAILANGVFSLWVAANYLPLFFAAEKYWSSRQNFGQDYIDTVTKLMPTWMCPVMFAVAFVCGIVGGFLGKSLLKKHFEKAGIA